MRARSTRIAGSVRDRAIDATRSTGRGLADKSTQQQGNCNAVARRLQDGCKGQAVSAATGVLPGAYVSDAAMEDGNGRQDQCQSRGKLSFLLENGDFAMLTKQESDALRTRPGNDVRQSGCWGDPSSMMVRTCGPVKPVLTGEPTNPGSNGRVWLA